jgi:tetratricopeptide (TPR) repeat protein
VTRWSLSRRALWLLLPGLGCGPGEADGPAASQTVLRPRRGPEAETRPGAIAENASEEAFERAMRLGDAALYAGRFELARDQFLQAMALRPDSMAPALGAVRALQIRGGAEARAELASRIARRAAALAQDPATHGSGLLLTARLALARGAPREALDAAYLAVLELPEAGAAWRVLGEAAMADEHWSDAVRALRRALELGVEAEAGTWERLADALDELGDPPGAVDAARKAVALTGGDPHARRRRLNLLAVVLRHDGQREDAEEALEQAALLGPDDPAVLHNRAAFAEARGELEEALALYEQALAQTSSPTTLWRVGKLHLKRDAPEAALSAMIQAAGQIDRWTWPLSLRWHPAWEVGKLYSRAGRYRDATVWFEDAARETRDGASEREVRAWLAWARAQADGPAPAPLGDPAPEPPVSPELKAP